MCVSKSMGFLNDKFKRPIKLKLKQNTMVYGSMHVSEHKRFSSRDKTFDLKH